MSWLEFPPISPQLSLFLLLGLLLLAAKLAQSVFGHLLSLGVPAALLLGLVLGPSGWNIWQKPAFAALTDERFVNAFTDLTGLCTGLLLFATGLRLRFAALPRLSLAAVLAAVGTGGGGFLAAWYVANRFGAPAEAVLLLAAVGAASSIAAATASFRELAGEGQMETTAALTGWLLNNLWGAALLTLAVARLSQPDRSWGAAFATLLKSALFLGCATLLGYAVFTWVGNWLARLRAPGLPLAWGLVSALLMAVAAEYLAGVPAAAGALLAGIIHGRLSSAEALAEQLRPIVDAVAVPLMLLSLGLQINLRPEALAAGYAPGALFAWAGSVLLTKALLAALFTRLCGATWLASARVGTALSAPGETGLAMVSIGLAAGVLPPPFAVWAVVVAALPLILQPLLLRLLWIVPRPAETPAQAVPIATDADM